MPIILNSRPSHANMRYMTVFLSSVFVLIRAAKVMQAAIATPADTAIQMAANTSCTT